MGRGKAPRQPLDQVAGINERFREEVERYNLLYRCDRCIHVRGAQRICVLGYPNEMLAHGDVRALDDRGEFVFCKDFELED